MWEDAGMREDLGMFTENQEVQERELPGQGTKTLVNEGWTACRILEDFGFACVGHWEPAGIFKAGGDRMGLIFEVR